MSLPAPDFTDSAAAALEWALCARVIAGHPAQRMMVRRTGRVTYPQSSQRPLSQGHPSTPAAVMLWDRSQRLPVLALDFDAKNGAGPRTVAADVSAATELLRRVGLHPFADRGPTGGWHVYAPLPHPAAAHEVRQVAAALAAQLPSLDIAPLVNPLHGCIRPPGSPHKAGGYQRLSAPIQEVRAALATEPAADAWRRLRRTLNADTYHAAPPPADIDDRPAYGVHRRPVAAAAEQLATTGTHPHRRFASPSEARYSVICHAVNAGMSLADIEQALQHRWAWLKASYGTKHHTAVARDFTKAKRHRRDTVVNRHVRISDTSPRNSQRGLHQPHELDLHVTLRRFTSFAKEHARRQHYSPTLRAVLNAVIWAGHVQRRILVNTGVRALAEQCALHYDTVAEMLHQLAVDGLIHRMTRARGTEADIWRISIELGTGWPLARGKRIGLRKVFRVLGGHLVGEVYETLRQLTPDEALNSGELAQRLGYDRRRIHEAVLLLAGWDLASHQAGGWRVGDADVEELGRRLGGHEDWQIQHDRHLDQRAAWRRVVDHTILRPVRPTVGQLAWQVEFAAVEPESTWIEEFAGGSPPRQQSPEQTALSLVKTVLGGVVVA